MVSFFRRPQQLKASLTKTRASFLTRMTALIAKNEVNEEFWSGLEETLIAADVGVETTVELVDKLRARAEKARVREATRVQEMLKGELLTLLEIPNPQSPIPNASLGVVLVVGVNGSGKTTSVA